MLKGEHYCITKENIGAHELIGLNAKVCESADCNKGRAEGRIVDETKNLLIFETKNGKKKIPKKECAFEFELGNEKAVVKGEAIIEKPENRIKVFRRKKHAVQ